MTRTKTMIVKRRMRSLTIPSFVLRYPVLMTRIEAEEVVVVVVTRTVAPPEAGIFVLFSLDDLSGSLK